MERHLVEQRSTRKEHRQQDYNRKVLVLGGHGFIGRHAVTALQTQGAHARIGTRSKRTSRCRTVRLETMLTDDAWQETIDGFDVVLNCVGILRPSGTASYDRVHHQAVAALAAACAHARVRLVHVSALGLHADAGSGFIRSKLAGEAAVAASPADWIVARPSLLDGQGGYGAAWLRGVARLPVFLAPTRATGRIAALQVTDLGDALARLCLTDAKTLALAHSRYFELGGAVTVAFADYIRGLRRAQGYRSKALAIPLPGWIPRLGAHLCDVLRFSPFSFGHWELLQRDNVPAPNRLEELLGRPALPVVMAAGDEQGG